MKPDQHKQKQSAKYKKKHGIKDNKKSNDSVPVAESHSKGKRQGGSKTVGDKEAPAAPPSSNVNAKPAGATGQDIEESRVFSRRKLCSNWDRYEESERALEEENSLPSVRGADFSQVLNSAGDAVSQFRLKAEAEWDAEVSESSGDAILSLDLVDLAAALQCVPLHTKLGISENLFQEEQIRNFHQEAKENYEKWKAQEHEENTSNDRTALDLEQTEQSPAAEEEEKEIDILDDILDVADRTEFKGELSISACDIKLSSTHQSDLDSNQMHTDKSVEDDLDDLLNIGNSERETIKCDDTLKTVQEDQLDNLLNPDSKSEIVCDNSSSIMDSIDTDVGASEILSRPCNENGKMDSSAKTPGDTNTGEPAKTTGDTNTVFKPAVTENLDDWLDSMLDD